MIKLSCYYAHFMGIYDTPQEERDIELLNTLGFSVTNPNCDRVREGLELYKEDHPNENYMLYFEDIAVSHDVVAFRALPDGTLPGGVAKEVMAAKAAGKIIIELPCGIARRCMNHEETVEYLENIGQR